MTTRSTAKQAIAPGTLPYGERQNFETAIDNVIPQRGGPSADQPTLPGRPSAAPPVGETTPLDFLLNSQTFKTPLPVTSGLTLGPGPGPQIDLSGLPLDRMARLQEIATRARSPVLRAQARILLRELARKT